MKNNFLKSSSILLIGEIFTKIIGILYLIPLYNINPELGSIMATLFVPYGFILIFAAIGINNVMASEVSKYYLKNEQKLKEALHNGILFIAVSAALATMVLYMGAPLLIALISPNDPYTVDLIRGIQILGIAVILFAITNYMRAVLMGFGKFKIVSFSYFTEQIIRITIILIATYYVYIVKGQGIEATIYVFSIATVISILSTLIFFIIAFIKFKYYKYFIKTQYYFSKKSFIFISISGFVFFINGLFITAFDQIDLLMMYPFFEHIKYSANDILMIKGIYFNWSLKLIMIPIGLSTAFVSAMIHQYHSGDKPKQETLKILRTVYVYCLFFTSGFLIFGTEIYSLIYSQDPLGGSLIKGQALLITFYVMRTMISIYLVMAGRKFKVFKNNLILLIVKPIINIVLIITLGWILTIYTFIIASVISIILTTLILITQNRSLFIDSVVKGKTFVAITIKMVIITLVMMIINQIWINLNINNLFGGLVVMGIVFLLFVFIAFKKEVKSIIQIKKNK